MTDARVRAITLALLAVLGVYCAWRLELTNSILHFIPSPDEAELVELSLDLVDSPLSRRMVLSVGGGPERTRVAAELAEGLKSHAEIAWVASGLDEGAMRSIYKLYFDRRIYLASDTPEAGIAAMLEPKALEQRAARLRKQLAAPDSMLRARTAPADPLGLFDLVLERIQATQPMLSTQNRVFSSTDGDYAIVLLGLRSSAFDSATQAGLLRDIEAQFARINAAHGGGMELEQAGVNRIAVASERRIRGELNVISVLSITVVCAIFLLVFRSLRHLLIAILTPLGGFVAALALTLWFSGPIHGITLGFGFVLIGIAIDYPIHLMNHHALSAVGSDPRESIGRIRSSLLLSALTTTLAFAVLASSELPGLSAMGAFAAVGVPVSLAITLFSAPAFLRPSAAPTSIQSSISGGFVRLTSWLGERRRLAKAIVAGLGAIAAAGLPQLRWEDDPGSLMAVDPSLLAENERIRQRVNDVDGGRFVVALAADVESALVLNDEIYRRLEQVIASGQMEGMHSLHSYLWSQALQRENLAAFGSVPDLHDRIDRAFSRQGFRPGSFRGFGAAVAEPRALPLLPADVASSPLTRALDSMAELDGRWAVVTYLRGVASGEAIASVLDGLDGAHYVDQQDIIAELYQGYRRTTLRLAIIGSVLVFLVLQLRYRNIRYGVLAFVPSALVALTTLGLFGLAGVPVNVVAVISLLVVLGIGVDYGIFTVDGARRPERLGATLSSLLISCLTTIFVFGILALSGQPALRAIGLTTGTGVILALLISPVVAVLARRS